ncbi:TetR/AcrR family transcriptional regulator [Kibdelosporangium lantanae]
MTATTRGRPRAFDRAEALDKAIRVFWANGYDPTSITELTRAMNIGAPSLYAAFGDKRALFHEAVATYQATYGAFTAQAMAEEPTARAAVSRMLHEAADHYTDDTHPHGCLVISAATNCTTPDVATWLRTLRADNVKAIEDLIATEYPAAQARALALFTATTIQGMSQQARDGAERADLEAVADVAMRAWP